jgi:two-component system, OmpR family, sensor kinase
VTPFGRYVRGRMHRRIFWWFGATILFTLLVEGVVMTVLNGGQPGWRKDLERAETFVAGRFALAWDDPAARDEVARAFARDLDVDVRVNDASGHTLEQIGPPFDDRHAFRIPVVRGDATLGTLEVSGERHHAPFMRRGLFALALAAALIWLASRVIARRLSFPIEALARLAEDLGSGRLGSRIRMRNHGEVARLAQVLNRMADRIEKQLTDQRELLAAVSHEIKTPLARIRLMLELARERGVDDDALVEIDREVVEMDQLVGDLLASSRLDFAALSPTSLDAKDVATRALERAGKAAGLLSVEPDAGGRVELEADPTLLARALANLIQNAERHGRGLTRLRVRGASASVAFEAEDSGPGFAEGEVDRIFEPFYRGTNGQTDGERGSLGLGLSLVRRIAEAHAGRAYAAPRPEGGAMVGMEIARRVPANRIHPDSRR